MHFEEYQAAAVKLPACPDGINLSMTVAGMLQECGHISRLIGNSTARDISLEPTEAAELRERMADVLWYMALIANSAGISLDDAAKLSLRILETRSRIGFGKMEDS